MSKILFLFLFVTLVACNNQSNDAETVDTVSADTLKKKSFTWPADEEKEFLAGCVDNAKAKLGDTAAYSYCHCILAQVEQTYPNMDSASAVLMDSTQVIAYAKNCR